MGKKLFSTSLGVPFLVLVTILHKSHKQTRVQQRATQLLKIWETWLKREDCKNGEFLVWGREDLMWGLTRVFICHLFCGAGGIIVLNYNTEHLDWILGWIYSHYEADPIKSSSCLWYSCPWGVDNRSQWVLTEQLLTGSSFSLHEGSRGCWWASACYSHGPSPVGSSWSILLLFLFNVYLRSFM